MTITAVQLLAIGRACLRTASDSPPVISESKNSREHSLAAHFMWLHSCRLPPISCCQPRGVPATVAGTSATPSQPRQMAGCGTACSAARQLSPGHTIAAAGHAGRLTYAEPVGRAWPPARGRAKCFESRDVAHGHMVCTRRQLQIAIAIARAMAPFLGAQSLAERTPRG